MVCENDIFKYREITEAKDLQKLIKTFIAKEIMRNYFKMLSSLNKKYTL